MMRCGLSSGKGRAAALGAALAWASAAALMAGPAAGRLLAAEGSDWPQFRGPSRDGVWTEAPAPGRFPSEHSGQVWSYPTGGGFSGPTVAGGRVFLMDRPTPKADAERVICLDAQSGRLLWTHQYSVRYATLGGYDNGPRASVTVEGDRAYCLGAMGHLMCLDVSTGRVLWKRDLIAEFKARLPVWGVAAHPLIEATLLILPIPGAKGASLVALDKLTGRLVWKSLTQRDGYSAPIVTEAGGVRQVVYWCPQGLIGVKATDGAELWRHEFRAFGNASIIPPIRYRNRLLVSSNYEGTLALDLATDKPGVSLAWTSEELQCIMSTPMALGDYLYAVDNRGYLRCHSFDDGALVWKNDTVNPIKDKWAQASITRQGDRAWIFNELGWLILFAPSPEGYNEIGRVRIIENATLKEPAWAYPAYAAGHVYARGPSEIVCYRVGTR